MIRVYRFLLLLYPAGFRREFGPEMSAMFADRAAAAGTFGSVGLLLGAIPEIFWNAVLLHWEILRQDLRYTARTLRRAPGFAFTVILVTALGVGANTAAFSMTDFVLVRPLPFPNPESIVRLCEGPRTGTVGWGCMNELSPANFRDFQQQTKSFESLGAYRTDAVNLVGGGEPQRLNTALVTPEVMPLLGVRPVLGNVFDARDRSFTTRSVVLSYALWQSQFAADPNVLGKSVRLDDAPYTVIGVMPPDFHFPSREVQVWQPLQLVEEDFADRQNTYLQGVGRLKPGVTFEQARTDLDLVVNRLAHDYPETNAETGVSFFRMRDEYSPRFRVMLQALCGATICILILACANLANLLLARAGSRERELAVRAALGAGKERLVRQMVTESVALAALGGAAGAVLSVMVFPLLSLMVPWSLPIATQPNLNARVFLLAALFTALTALGFGVLPALRAAGGAALSALRVRSVGGRQRFRAVLVGIEVAASVVLLVSAGLLIRAMLRVQATEPGFKAEQALSLRTSLPKPKYLKAAARERFYGEVLREVRRLPGVQSAAYTSGVPFVMFGGITRVVLPGQDAAGNRRAGNYSVSQRYITPQFFSAMGIPFLRGRDFEELDAANNRRVAVVSESFAQRYWPGGDALGQAFLFNDSIMTVVGVVGNVKVRGLERESEPQLYMPTSLAPESPMTFYDPKDLVVRANGSATSLIPAIRGIIRSADPDQPVSDVQTLSELMDKQTAARAAQVRALLVLAAVAVLLAGFGIYGLLAYMVAQQRQDIAVRLALGAEPGRIARGVMWNGVSIVLVGLIPGLFVAFAAGRSMSSLLFGVQPRDPIIVLATVALCVFVSISGALLPALRSVRVSPMSVMRSE